MTDCIFCKILEKKIPAEFIAENSGAVVIQDLHPKAPIHLLVLAKKHVSSLNEMTPEDRREILPALYAAADEVAATQGFKERGYRTVINNQAGGGQSVFHLHLHVLAGAGLSEDHF